MYKKKKKNGNTKQSKKATPTTTAVDEIDQLRNGAEILKRLLNVNFVVSSRTIYVQITLQAVFMSCCSSVVGLFLYYSSVVVAISVCFECRSMKQTYTKNTNQMNLNVCFFLIKCVYVF